MEWLLSWLPAPATLDAILLGLFVGPALLLGVPILRAVIRVPRRMSIEPVSEADLSPAVREFFARVESRLRTEGFNPGATFRVVNLPGHNVNRAYISAGEPTIAMATVGSSDQEGVAVGARYVEYVTEYADGSIVGTRSAAAEDPFDLLPGQHRFVHPQIEDPLALKAKHIEHCEAFVLKEAQHCERDAVLDRLRDFHMRWVAHQEDRGLLRRLPEDPDQDGATARLAIRGLATYFNPFAEGFTTRKLVSALVLGFALPVTAIAALALPEVPIVPSLVAATGLAESLVTLLVMAPILLAGAAVVGWIFTGNALLWGFLMSYASSRLLLPDLHANDLALVVWLCTLIAAPLVAQRVETLRVRRAR